MNGEFWDRLESQPLYLDQTETPLQIERVQVRRFYAPLARFLRGKLSPARRLLVAIAGPPGSGKSAFATTLNAVIDAQADASLAICLGLDGWHYPNDYLDTHSLEISGEQLPLRRLKGAPETFDARAAFACLSRIRRGEMVRFPVYSRQRHDPLSDAGVVLPKHRLVLAEGNYWLLDEPPWMDFRPLFDVTIFLVAGLQQLEESLRRRHLRGGKTPAEVERHLQNVDLPNVRRVLDRSAPADILIFKADSLRIERMQGAGL
jgi:pantothenate kinase